MKTFGLLLAVAVASAFSLHAENAADIYSTAKLKEVEAKLIKETKASGKGFASETLNKYGNHYTMLAHREQTGSSEVHQKESDFFFVVTGDATLTTGGTVVKPTTSGPGEIRGTGISGGKDQKLAPGDVVHIDAGVPHQLKLKTGTLFTYFVIKVIQP